MKEIRLRVICVAATASSFCLSLIKTNTYIVEERREEGFRGACVSREEIVRYGDGDGGGG
jgi:hypothetical protein